MSHAFVGRKEDARLLIGKGQFTDDLNLAGQLYGFFLRADRAHAEIRGIDIALAKAMPGVLDILTSAEMRAAKLGQPGNFIPSPGRDGKKFILPPRDYLAHDKVRYVGEAIALVVAETALQAQDAAEQIKLDWRDLPVVIDPQAAMQPGAPQLYADVPNNTAFDWEFGDPAVTDAIFATAPHRVAVRVDNTRVITNPLEPNACIADWNEERVDVYRPHQGPFFAISPMVQIFGPPFEKYRVIARDVGGSFGTRAVNQAEHMALLIASKRLGRPVKWLASRNETMLSDTQGRSAITAGELAFDADGKFLAVRYDWISSVGGYPTEIAAAGHVFNFNKGAVGCYNIPAVYGRCRVAVTNTGQVGAYRGAGRPEIALNLERLVDKAAAQLGIDRYEIRRRNVLQPAQFPYKTPHGITYDSGDHPALMALSETLIDWKGFPARRAEAKGRGKVRGIGCSSYLEGAGGPFAQKEQTMIRLTPQGRVEIATIAGPSGQGYETTFALVLSRALGIPYEDVDVTNSDPGNYQPGGPKLTGMGTGGSRAAQIYGNAVHQGAQEVIRKGLRLAANALEAAEQDVEFKDGSFAVKGTDLKIRLRELAAQHPGELDSIGEVDAMGTFPGGSHAAEVELDPETGVFTMIAYAAADDNGNLIDHTLVEGQIIGGVVQGLGQMFGEVALYDAQGQLLTASFMDYFMPRADLVPDFRLASHPAPSPTNVLGIKGVGESGCSGALTATYSAVMDALAQVGVTQMDMPFTPCRVWEAIEKAKAGA